MAKKAAQQEEFSDFNLQLINTVGYSEHLKASIELGTNVAVFGLRGSGKTLIAKEVIAESGHEEVYLNLSVLERPDLGGYPKLLGENSNSEFVRFVLPSFFEKLIKPSGKKRADGSLVKTVLLLDEIEKADPSVLAPLLEITQFHSINGTPLPNLLSCIMTGNLICEGSSRPSLPLLDRAEKYMLQSDPDQWLRWAATSKIHPAVTSFIHDMPQHLHGSGNSDDSYADKTPRGWHRSSDILTRGEKMGLATDILSEKVCACVGKSVGLQFRNYIDHYQHVLPIVNKVFSDCKSSEYLEAFKGLARSRQLVTSMIVASRFMSYLSEGQDVGVKKARKIGPERENALTTEQALERSANYFEFVERVNPEDIVPAVRSHISLPSIFKYKIHTNERWMKFLSKVNDFAFNK